MNVMIATYIFFSYSPLSTPHKYTGENYPPGTTLILLAILFLLPSIPFPSLPLLIYIGAILIPLESGGFEKRCIGQHPPKKIQEHKFHPLIRRVSGLDLMSTT